MPRIVRGGLIQAGSTHEGTAPLDVIKKAMVEKHMGLLEQAAKKGCQVVCLQEIFYGPYFCAEQKTHWYGTTEHIPDGPTTQLMCETARRLGMVLVIPIYEVEGTGIYYNTAAVIDADGKYLGKYRKHHIPHCAPGFWEKFYFRPGNLGYPVFQTAVGKIGVYICYDRHFPEGARCLGLNGAEIVFNPSATVAGLSEYLWRLEQPAHAVANQYFIGAINRVGVEKPWAIGEFYGQSYFCDPRGQMLAVGSRDKDEIVVADLDLEKIQEVRDVWQFYRDRRPETYNEIVTP
jgi:beta-ureidopropionase